MPSTKNATNRVRKSRRQGIPATTGTTSKAQKAVPTARSRGGAADVPAQLPANGSKSATKLITKRKAERKPERADRRGERTEPRQQQAARKTRPTAARRGKSGV